MSEPRPIVGITIGDPAGIGPEIIVKTLAAGRVYSQVRPVAIGSAAILRRELEGLGLAAELNRVASPRDGKYRPGVIDVVDVDNVPAGVPYGVVSAANGTACFEWVKRSVDLALSGEIDGVATGPIHKQAVHEAGIEYIGHTEMYAGLTRSSVITMFHCNRMRIFFLSRHLSLLKAIEYVTHDNVLRALEKCDRALRHIGYERPRIAVAALNPHAGDNGMCGDEEVKALGPAVRSAVAKGIDASGPLPADSVFLAFETGRFDAVLSLYHDQGHIASKVHDFMKTIAITIGLPFVRTAVDHGTAFDIAGKGIANPVSMEESILLTGHYAPRLKHAKV